MDYQIGDKTAFVSGSTSGIGLAIATQLAHEGVRVIINGRSEERIEEAKEKILSIIPGATISGVAADFADERSIKSLITKIESIDILINNVGIFTSQSFTETSDDDWFKLFEVNVLSGVRLSRALLPGMINRNWGRIIFISSECAQLVPEDLIAYSTSKAALLSISRGLVQTTKGTNVTVNSVIPGSTLSEGAQRFLKEQAEKDGTTEEEVASNFFKEVRTTSLLRRFASTEEVASTVTYLASSLSSATNGAAIKADGGSIPGII